MSEYLHKKVLQTPHGIRVTIETNQEITKDLILDVATRILSAIESDHLFLEVEDLEKMNL